MEKVTAESSSRSDYLKERVKDFFAATMLFDSAGYDIQETHSPTILWGMVTDDMDIVEKSLTEAFEHMRRLSDELRWFREVSREKAERLTQPLS